MNNSKTREPAQVFETELEGQQQSCVQVGAQQTPEETDVLQCEQQEAGDPQIVLWQPAHCLLIGCRLT